tara:strand:+ start:239 stop:679 length:441 start_codon:yes stop_codon:yes gene_type:complete
MKLEDKEMITGYIIASIAGILIGGGSVLLINKKTDQDIPPIVVSDQVAKEQQEVIKQVTSPELVGVSCSKEHIDTHGDLLCREMFCRLQTRGMDSKTSGSECEQISNISNTLKILEVCVEKVEVEDRDDPVEVFNENCTRLFRERK